MNRIHLVLAVSLAVGCASTSQPRAQSGLATRDEYGNKVVCQMERPLGSNIAEMVCRTQESIDAGREATQNAIQTAPKTGMSPKNN